MSRDFCYFVFPRDSLFVPNGSRLLAALEALDQEWELGLAAGAAFSASFVLKGDDLAAGRSGEAQDYLGLRSALADSSQEVLEATVELPRPGRDPLAGSGLLTESLEARVFPHPRLVSLAAWGAYSLCPACGERQALDLADSERPDPRLYCSSCGGLTPIQDTEMEVPSSGGGEPLRLRAPCYRFLLRLAARRATGGEERGESVVIPEVSLALPLESALGCGLRALLVKQPDP